jgi:hypothetical protein
MDRDSLSASDEKVDPGAAEMAATLLRDASPKADSAEHAAVAQAARRVVEKAQVQDATAVRAAALEKRQAWRQRDAEQALVPEERPVLRAPARRRALAQVRQQRASGPAQVQARRAEQLAEAAQLARRALMLRAQELEQ